MLNQYRLCLGKYFGIGVYVHWTFGLLVAYAALTPQSDGSFGVFYSVLQLFAIFFCVTLHEYGHALTARRFGIQTQDITLLPIGGVARLERMPRIPWQEFLVAIAGPAVNVVIICGLLIGFWTFVPLTELTSLIPKTTEATYYLMYVLSEPSIFGFALGLLIVNTMLVLFNLIPAFPMDGGRVFRSIAASFMDYRRATWLASRVGIVIGICFALIALRYGQPMPIIIAIFIGYAGIQEAKQIEMIESVRGLTAGDVMIPSPPSISMDTPTNEIMTHWQSTSLPIAPVVGINDIVVGVISLSEFTAKLGQTIEAGTTVGQIANHEWPIVSENEALEKALASAGLKHRFVPVVDAESRLVGLLDFSLARQRGDWVRAQRAAASRKPPASS